MNAPHSYGSYGGHHPTGRSQRIRIQECANLHCFCQGNFYPDLRLMAVISAWPVFADRAHPVPMKTGVITSSMVLFMRTTGKGEESETQKCEFPVTHRTLFHRF